MNALVKTPEQIEIAEIFLQLELDYRMTQAEVARELNLSRTYIGYLIQGRRQPPPRTLEDFRKLLAARAAAKKHGKKIEQTLSDLDMLCDRIATMQKQDPPNFEVVKKVVESLSPSKPKSRKRNAVKKVSAEIIDSSSINSDPAHTGHIAQKKVPFPQYDEAMARMKAADQKNKGAGDHVHSPQTLPSPKEKTR